MLVGADHEGTPIEEADERAELVPEARVTQDRECSLCGSVRRADARPESRCRRVRLRIPRVGGDALKQVVIEDLTIGQNCPAFFIARVVVDLGTGRGERTDIFLSFLITAW